jgi:hypothetical protein
MRPYLAIANWYEPILSDRPVGWVVSVWWSRGKYRFRAITVGNELPPDAAPDYVVRYAFDREKLTLEDYDNLDNLEKTERDNNIKL